MADRSAIEWTSTDFTPPSKFVLKGIELYLRNLTPLIPTGKLSPPRAGTDAHRAWSKVHRMPPGPHRARERSRFFPGVAAAMAEQWG